MSRRSATIRMIKAVKQVDIQTYVTAAMTKCDEAFGSEYDKGIEAGDSIEQIFGRAKVRYKLAMPRLEGIENIKAYIACLAQAINFQVYTAHEAGQLLYAAQVALGIEKRNEVKKPVGRPRADAA